MSIEDTTPIYYDMLQLHDPDNGRQGDCFRACLATLLQRDPTTVPHFVQIDKDSIGERNWYKEVNLWLKEHYGLCMIIVNGDKSFTDAYYLERSVGIPLYHMVCGATKRGTLHAVIGQNGRVVFDPHPSRDGLINVDSMYFLVPINPLPLSKSGK